MRLSARVSIVASLLLFGIPLAQAAPPSPRPAPAPRALQDRDAEDADPEALAGAIAAYEAKKPQAASAALFELLKEGSHPEKESKIQYFLALSLADLHMWHASQHYLVQVVKKGPDDPWFALALPRLSAVAAFTGDESELARIAAKVPADVVPARAHDQMAYLRGVNRLEAGDLAGARAELDQVSEKSDFYPRARYLAGVALNQQQRLKSAATAFLDVAKAPPAGDTPHEQAANERARDLSILNVGRLYYGIERFDAAEQAYRAVPRRSDYWPQSVFERAWVDFVTNEPNDTLGALLTLRAPSIAADTWLPEADVLEALTWFNLCESAKVERTMLRFEARYRPMDAELRAVLKEYGTADGKARAADAFDRYFGERPQETVLPKALFAHVLRDRELAGLVGHLQEMDAEEALVRAQKAQWRDTVGAELLDVLGRDRERLRNRAGLAFLGGLSEAEASLRDLLQQAEIIRFEQVDFTRRRLITISEGDTFRDETGREELSWAESSDRVAWPFNGEFWDDELGTYRYTEQGSCR